MKYLNDWEKCSEQKGGEPKDVAQQLLSQETLQGIAITGMFLACLLMYLPYSLYCSLVIFGTCAIHPQDS